jgi:hypothetical protein
VTRVRLRLILAALAVGLVAAAGLFYFAYGQWPAPEAAGQSTVLPTTTPALTRTPRPAPTGTPGAGSPTHEPVGEPPPTEVDQAQFIKHIESDRKALYNGIASTRLFRTAVVGQGFLMELRVCAPKIDECSVAEPLGPETAGEPAKTLAAGQGAPPPAPGYNKPLGDVKVGGRVEAKLTTVERSIKIDVQSAEVQIIASENDVGHWYWGVVANRPGVFYLRITVTTLRGDTDQALGTPADFPVRITVEDTWSTWLERMLGYAGGLITGIGVALATIITAVIGIFVHRHNRRLNPVPARRVAETGPPPPGWAPVRPPSPDEREQQERRAPPGSRRTGRGRKMTDQQREQAATLGRLAFRAGRPVTECPYSPTGSPADRAKAAVWVRAWQNAAGAETDVDYGN